VVLDPPPTAAPEAQLTFKIEVLPTKLAGTVQPTVVVGQATAVQGECIDNIKTQTQKRRAQFMIKVQF
jgi:hypothetical protein